MYIVFDWKLFDSIACGVIFFHNWNTRYLKLDYVTVSFEESLNSDIWTHQIASLYT